ncbi:BON domain-containing protein [Thalassotalea litorea]|uniref:BON domain-containing protein n=1 Tax=Thalassotalea litorea TaxID=2020715 RepID=UPI00373695AE
MLKQLILISAMVCTLQGCAVALVGAAAGGAIAYNDRRTLGAQVDDQAIEVKAYGRVRSEPLLEEATNVKFTSVNGHLLIVGQAPTQTLKDQIIGLVSDIPGVRKLHNQIRVGKLLNITSKGADSWLTTKVKTELMLDERVDASAIKVVTEDSEVFLMGLVNQQESQIAVDIVRNVYGVAKVYRAFEHQ